MRTKLFTFFTLFALLVAACGANTDVENTPAATSDSSVVIATQAPDTTEDTTDEVAETPTEEPVTDDVTGDMINPIEFTGDIAIAGSSTVFPLSERMKERFENDGFGGQITVDSIGSGGGFERFCVEGESDVSNASRAIRDSEIEQCEAIGRNPIEFRVGTDALAVVVSNANDFVDDVTHEELAAIFSTAETWADVRADWPAEPIQRFIPGTDSGTFDYFVEEVFEEDQEPILAASNLELSENDNVLVQGATGSPYAVAFFGYAYFQENAGVLKALSIDGVEPSQESVDAAAYPLARPLYMYSDAGIMAEKPQVSAFIQYFLEHVNEEIIDVGYFPANAAVLANAMDRLMAGENIPVEGMMEEEEMVDEGDSMDEGDMMIDPIEYTGDIAIAGSSTVFPLSERMKERFENDGFGGQITVDSIGSGGGFERFCVEGESDISNASRAIRDSEIEQCEAIGRNPIEFRVGTDALAVVVSNANDFVDDVTHEELAAIFSTAETWADVRADWPAEPIQRFIPGTDSGTFDYFVEEVFEEDQEPILAASNLELSENDNVLVQGATGSPYAIAFFGYAYFQENADVLKALSIDGVEPSQESVDAAAYPLARPLYMYSDAGIMAEKPQVSAFIQFFLERVNEEIIDVGYFPANDAVLANAMERLHAGENIPVEGMMEEEVMDEEMMDEGAIMLPEIDPIAFTGDIAMAGSSTVFPLAERMKERFEDDGFGGTITVDSIGSGGGFERFCVEGESDISNASRAIRDSEIEQCEAIGRTPIEFRVGTDALAVVVSAENDFVDDVTHEELAAIFSTAETWADVRADWPAEPIQRFIPGTDSGTFDYFVEEVFEEDQEPILAASNLELSENDNVLVQGATGSPYAVAFFGFAYYQENAGVLKALSIDGVEPSQESVDAAEYPLARPLYIYSDAGIIAEKPQVGAFISYFLSTVNEEIVEVGYFPAGQSDLNSAKQKLADALQ